MAKGKIMPAREFKNQNFFQLLGIRGSYLLIYARPRSQSVFDERAMTERNAKR
jgi:hypothetical protein